MSADIAQMRSMVRELQQDLVAFRNSEMLRARLKHYEIQEDLGELDELAELAEFMDELQPRPRRRKRRRSAAR